MSLPRMLAWAALAMLLAVACDPVLEGQVGALGGEVSGVPTGPLHRPGQPCTLCHDGAAGDPPAFSVAGTVFRDPSGTFGTANVTVTVTGADGQVFTTTTNAAGNFYFTPYHVQPKYPTRVSLSAGGVTVAMQSHIGWAGSCASCHSDPAGPSSPGHVYFDVPAGGTP
jgi:hypothetical protein